MGTQTLHLEVPTACSVACLLAANSWKNNSSWMIQLILFSRLAPLPPSLWWLHASLSDPPGNDLKCSARSRWLVCHDPWVRPQVSVDGNHDMKWVEGLNMFKHPQLHMEKIEFNSSPSPAAIGTKKINCWTSPDFTIRRTPWSKLHTDPRATNIQNTVISLRCLHRSSYSGQRLLERYQSWKQH